MKKLYIQPYTEVHNINLEKSLLVTMSGESSPFGENSGEQPEEGVPTVNSRRGSLWDDEEY